MFGCAGKASVVDASSFRPSPSSPSVPPLAGFPTDSAAEKDCRTEGINGRFNEIAVARSAENPLEA